MEDRVVVLFNDKGQPIGPTDKVVNEFSKFLGTIAHDHTWAPLIYTNWSEVPHKDEMWGYVNKNKEGRSPSKTRMFEETRKRKEGRTYKHSNNDTLDKIKKMEEIEASQESGLSSSDEDPFDKVIKKERLGRLRLYERGVCTTNLKRNDVDKPQALAPKFIHAIRVDLGEEMQKDFDAHKEKMDVELKAEKDKVANMQKELDSEKAVLDAQKAELNAQKANYY
ncbi:hypothetical protein Cgig2_033795 [Carnegiea gigantea]|uniref:Uncharacterized protein n=1 Tax=Carnegiea gigantea TaxID=171969 RepID=A0A9Q1JKN0_9CARY|nr:hypothetical protein Cgig2_033795 [Carnegiea gigantea]